MIPADSTRTRYGLYYPYFHVRDERWLRLAALYWPRLVRIVPEDYPTRDSETVRALRDEAGFIQAWPPGRSVHTASAVMLAVVRSRGEELRSRYAVDVEAARTLGWRAAAPHVAAVHNDQVRPELAEALVETGLAVRERADLSHEVDRDWLVLHETLVTVYTSVLAEDCAAANGLIPTTDQSAAFAVAGAWSPDRVARALLAADDPLPGGEAGLAPGPHPDPAEVSGALALLAFELVVPARLESVPIRRIIDLRREHGAEFLAFRALVDQTAAELSQLVDLRDEVALRAYLHDVVDARLGAPLHELRRTLAGARFDVAGTAATVKTQVPAGAVAGGVWLTGHPAVAGTTMVALGLLAVGRGARRHREEAMAVSPEASYLLHVQQATHDVTLLRRTMGRLREIGGL